jgi:multicomponent Na+:H+ antiporter subunit A
MVWTPFLLLGLGALTPLLARPARGALGWIVGALPAGLFVWFLRYLPLGPGDAVRESIPWAPGLGAELAVSLDGLSATFALLVTGIGALVLVYAGAYMKGHPRRARLLALLQLFLGAMLGLVLADNLISLFVFWELTSVCSFLLIGLEHEKAKARDAAKQALLVTGAGGLCLLGGVVLLGLAGAEQGLTGGDAWRLSSLAGVELRESALYPAMLILLVLGAATKSAQFPFHFWLPSAMAAPTPVSALLHSATMVKAGVYLLARLHPMLGGTDLWQATLIPVGALTMVVAAVVALGQRDLKRILAYSTVSVLGMLVSLLGAGIEKAVEAVIVLLVAHALYKAALFMVAGNLDHETGTRDVTVLRGLRRLMPFTFAAGFVAALSKAGAPPMFGFVGKELLYDFKLSPDNARNILILAAVATNVILVATALLVGLRPFIGERTETPKAPHEAPPGMLLGPLLLATTGLFIGLFPAFFDESLGSATATAILGVPTTMKLKLFHGVSLAALSVLGLSAVTVATGIWLYHRTTRWTAPLGRFVERCQAHGPEAWYVAGLRGLDAGARRLTRLVQTGILRHYVMVLLVVAVVLVAPPLVRALHDGPLDLGSAVRLEELLLVVLATAGALFAIRSKGRLTAVASLGVTGAVVGLVYLLFGAPDLSITQLMVETLSVILFVLVFHHLPPFVTRSRPLRVGFDAIVAAVAGATMAGLTLVLASVNLDPAASRYYLETSQPEAHGRNVDNVILVDFRAIDTLGEITVLAAGGLGVYVMLKLVARRRKEGAT